MNEAKTQTQLAHTTITQANGQLLQTVQSINQQIGTVKSEINMFMEYLAQIRAESESYGVNFGESIINKRLLQVQDAYTNTINDLALKYQKAVSDLSLVENNLEKTREQSKIKAQQINREAGQYADTLRKNADDYAKKTIEMTKDEVNKQLRETGMSIIKMGQDHLNTIADTVSQNHKSAKELEQIIGSLKQNPSLTALVQQTRDISQAIREAAQNADDLSKKKIDFQQMHDSAIQLDKIQQSLKLKTDQFKEMIDRLDPIVKRTEKAINTAQTTTQNEHSFVNKETQLLQQFRNQLDNTIQALNQTIGQLNIATAKQFTKAEQELQQVITQVLNNHKLRDTLVEAAKKAFDQSLDKQQDSIQRAIENTVQQEVDLKYEDYPVGSKRRIVTVPKKQEETKQTILIPELTASKGMSKTMSSLFPGKPNLATYKPTNNNYTQHMYVGLGKQEMKLDDNENTEPFENNKNNENNEIGLEQFDIEETKVDIDEDSEQKVEHISKSGPGIGTVLALGAGLLILTVLLVKYRNRSRSRSMSDSEQ